MNFVDSKKEREKPDEPIDQAAVEQQAREAIAQFDDSDFDIVPVPDEDLPF